MKKPKYDNFLEYFITKNENDLQKIEAVVKDRIVNISSADEHKLASDNKYYGYVTIEFERKMSQYFTTDIKEKLVLSNCDKRGKCIWEFIEQENPYVQKFKK